MNVVVVVVVVVQCPVLIMFFTTRSPPEANAGDYRNTLTGAQLRRLCRRLLPFTLTDPATTSVQVAAEDDEPPRRTPVLEDHVRPNFPPVYATRAPSYGNAHQ